MSKYDYKFKIAVIGDKCVGKTSIMNRCIYGEYSEVYKKTIAVNYNSKVMEVDNKKIKLDIWDLSGDPSFRSIIKAYLENVVGVIFVYDVTNKESFENIAMWLKWIKEINTNDITFLLLGNKIDKINREVKVDEAIEFSLNNKMVYLEVSAKNYDLMNCFKIFTEFLMDDNVDTFFNNIRINKKGDNGENDENDENKNYNKGNDNKLLENIRKKRRINIKNRNNVINYKKQDENVKWCGCCII